MEAYFNEWLVLLPDERVRKSVLALRQDELFWHFVIQYFDYSNVRQYSDGFLGPEVWIFRALGIDVLTEERIQSFLPEAKQLYRKLLQGEKVQDLRQAALVALALREQGRKSSWMDVLAPLSELVAEDWMTVVACLCAMAGSLQAFFDVVVSIRARCSVVWGVHLFLLYQMNKEVLSNVLKMRPLAEQLIWLRQLVGRGLRSLSVQLAAEIVEEHLAEWNSARQNAAFQNNMQCQSISEICALADQSALAWEFLACSGDLLKSQQAEMALREAGFWLKKRDRMRALENVRKALPLMPKLASTCELELLFEEKVSSSVEELRGRFRRWQQGYIQWQRLPGLMLYVDWENEWRDWLSLLLQKGLLVEAQECVMALLAQDKLSSEAYEQVSCFFQQQGKLKEAIACQRSALLAEPSLAMRRRLASLLEENDEWQAALLEREEIYHQLGVVDGEDAAAFADCALRVGDAERAWNVCERWLGVRKDDGLANGLAGKALARLGRLDEALHCLEVATDILPRRADFWFERADVLKQQGAIEHALNVLRLGLSVLPDEMALQLALGRMNWTLGRYTEALPVLRSAVQNGNADSELAILLIDTQEHLGLKDEALETVQFVRCMYPNNAELAARHAQLLAEKGDLAGALTALDVAIQAEDAQTEWLRFYVRWALAEDVQIEKMEQVLVVLQRLLHIIPTDLEVRFLLGKVLLLQNEVQNAYAVFAQLAEEPELMHKDFAGEVWHGLGRAALLLNLVDAAVMAFQEAVQLLPPDDRLLKELAEAYEAAGMDHEAVQVARQIFTASDLAQAVWFARLLLRAGDVEGAVEVWEKVMPNIGSDVSLLLEMAAALQAANRSQQAWDLLQSVNLEELSPDLLRRMASLCYTLGHTERAFDSLAYAFAQSPQPLGLQALELAYLHGAMKQWDEGLPFVEMVLRQEVPMMDAWVWAADVLVMAGRRQAAMRVLEQALVLKTEDSVAKQIDEKDAGLAQHLFVEGQPWGVDRVDILLRLARLAALEGDLRKGLNFALKGLQLSPDSAMLRYLGAELAAAQAQTELAIQLVEPYLDAGLPEEQQDMAVACLTLLGELALRDGNMTIAEQCLQKGRQYGNEFARLLALKSRLLARQGKFWMANDVFDLAVVLAKNDGMSQPLVGENWLSARSLLNDWNEQTCSLWLGEALLDLQRWKEAFQFLDKALDRWGIYTGVWLVYLIAVVRIEEERWLYDAVHLGGRLPVVTVEMALKKLSGIDLKEVQQWVRRAKVIFGPSELLDEFSSNHLRTFEDAKVAFAVWLKNGNWQRAAEVLIRFTQDAWARLMVGFCQTMIGENEGLIIVQEAAQALSFQPFAQGLLAKGAEACEELDMALDAINQALQLWPMQAEWYAWAAELAERLGKMEDALTYWEQARQLAPQSVEYKLAYAIVCRATGRATLAVRILREAAALAPDHFLIWMNLALAYQQNGDLSSSLTCAERVCMLAPDSADGLILAGQIALQMGRLDDALRYARGATRSSPDSKDALMLLVDVFVQRGQLLEALEVLEQASEICRQIEEVERRWASLVAKVRGKEAALLAYRQVCLDFPESASALADLATVLTELGQLQEAMRIAYQVLRLDPTHTDMLLFLGRCFRQQGQLDQAVYFFGEAVRQSSQDLEAQLELGQTYQQRRQYSLALEAFERAAQIAPQDYRAFHLAGLAKRDAKDYPGAEAMLRHAVQLAPHDVSIRRQLAAVIALNMVQTVRETQ
jgi:tetratricopeptide (TPR) repeat protein